MPTPVRLDEANADAGDDGFDVLQARRALIALLGLRDCRYERWPFDALLPRIERGRIVLPADEPGARAYRECKPADGIELPVRSRGFPVGRFVLVPSFSTTGVALAPQARARALDLVDELVCERTC